jgi:hypothetical protein
MSLTGDGAVDVFIGLAFLFLVLSTVSSAINEGIASALNLRAVDLEKGIEKLLGSSEARQAFYNGWRIQALSKPKRFLESTRLAKRIKGLQDKKPSYIPSRAFALTLLEDVHELPGEYASLHARAEALVASENASEPVKRLLREALQAARLVEDEAGKVEALRKSLETAFDESMERVSGWYKRRTQLILFGIALLLVGAINADSFAIGQRLWKDDALRKAVVAQANKTVTESQANQADCAKADNSGTTPTPAEIAGKCLDQVRELGLPLGWSKTTSPRGWAIPGKALGLLMTVFALLLGAPFWFDLLGKVSQLRGAGATPKTDTDERGHTSGSGGKR